MINNRKAVTLIELLIVMALLSIVITLITSFYIFGARTFSSGQNQHDIQYEIRMASTFITTEIRTAYPSFDIIAAPNVVTGGDGYNYIYLENLIIKHCDESGTVTEKTSANISSFIVSLSQLSNKSNLVDVSIHATKATQNYEVNTQITLNNLKNLAPINDTTKQVLKYKKP